MAATIFVLPSRFLNLSSHRKSWLMCLGYGCDMMQHHHSPFFCLWLEIFGSLRHPGQGGSVRSSHPSFAYNDGSHGDREYSTARLSKKEETNSHLRVRNPFRQGFAQIPEYGLEKEEVLKVGKKERKTSERGRKSRPVWGRSSSLTR